MCAALGCDRLIPATAAGNARDCSKRCRERESGWRYRQRHRSEPVNVETARENVAKARAALARAEEALAEALQRAPHDAGSQRLRSCP